MTEETQTPPETSTSEMEPPTPTSKELNEAAAQETQTDPGMEIVNCPTCKAPRRQFVIVDDKCDSCRTRGQAPQIVPELGWPEVRARRDRLIAETDWTQLADVTSEISERYAPIRTRLRDVTEKPDPFAAWHELDAITVEIAK